MIDVLVVGAGPAGLTAGKKVAEKGFDVLILEKNSSVGSKVCAGLLSPPVIDRFKLDIPGKKLNHVSFNSKRNSAEVKLDKPILSVFREDLDGHLLNEALDAGAEIEFNKRYKGREKARFIVLANGVANIEDKRRLVIAAQTRIKDGFLQNPDVLRIFYDTRISPYGYGWVAPKEDSLVAGTRCLLSKLGKPAEIKSYLNNLLKMCDLSGAGVEIGFSPFKGPVKTTFFENKVLVGDAAGFASPWTGEGIYYAMVSGEMTAETIVGILEGTWTLRRYEEEWKKEFGKTLKIHALVAKVFYGRDWLMDYVVRKIPQKEALRDLIAGNRRKKGVSLWDLLKIGLKVIF